MNTIFQVGTASRVVICFIAVAAMWVPISASGSLIGGDLVSGDGLLTLDTSTNFEWLDITETLGLSYNQAEATSYVTTLGFRHATDLEVMDLFLNAGFTTIDTGAPNFTPENYAPALQVLSLLGCTLNCGLGTGAGRGWSTHTSYANKARAMKSETASAFGMDFGTAIANGISSRDLALAGFGNFLLRAAAPASCCPAVPAPEPSAPALYAVALITAGFVFRPRPLKRGVRPA